MINLNNITNNNSKEHNEQWPYIPDHPYRILIIGGSALGKTNTLLNLINEQKVIDKIYFYAKDLSEFKYEYLIKNRENAGKRLNDLKHLLNVQIQWMIFKRILIITIHTKEEKYYMFLMI